MTPSRLERALIRLEGDLRALGVSWALVGGLTLSALTEPRTCLDIEVVVAKRDESEPTWLVDQMVDRGYRFWLPLGRFKVSMPHLARLLVPDLGGSGMVSAQLMFSVSGVEAEVVAESQLLELIPGLAVPIPARGHLLALAMLLYQCDVPQDLVDIRDLLQMATRRDIQCARRDFDLITRRGFAYGRDLHAELSGLIARSPRPEHPNLGRFWHAR